MRSWLFESNIVPMLGVRKVWIFGLAAMSLALVLSLSALKVSANSDEFVDLKLVLAVDISLSMDKDEQHLQRQGYVAAFRDPAILSAIKSGPNGSIAVTYVEWAGNSSQSVVVPWHVIKSSEDAHAFAGALAAGPIASDLFTSISAAVLMSSQLMATSPVRGLRRVIDISGDGPNNSGVPVETAPVPVLATGLVELRNRKTLSANQIVVDDHDSADRSEQA